MRRLTVLSVAYPFAPVGPDTAGGAEQVLHAIDAALVAAGHRSLVVARADSTVAGELLPVPGREPAAAEAQYRDVAARIAEAVAGGVDLVHMHGVEYWRTLPPLGPPPGLPLLATLHLPPAWYPAEGLCPPRPRSFVHGVSMAEHAAIPPGPQVLPPIANGVKVALLGALRPRRCSYALVLARICPEKGIHLALDAAHAAGMRLLVAGEVFGHGAHRDYFEAEVRPRLDGWRRFVGPVGFARKRRLLAAARCLLVPSLAAETSSLVAMEAASCGTPVVAFRSGALPEVVEDGVTGFLVDDAQAMAAAMGRVGCIDPAACRETARARFDAGRMTRAYLGRYAALAA